MTQKPADGFSLPRSAENSAVASGRMPTSTAPCEAGRVRSAIEVSHGKPITQPSDTNASGSSADCGGKSGAVPAQPDGAEHGGDQRAAQRDEGGVELGHRHAGEGQGQAEHGHADQAEQHAARLVGQRWPRWGGRHCRNRLVHACFQVAVRWIG